VRGLAATKRVDTFVIPGRRMSGRTRNLFQFCEIPDQRAKGAFTRVFDALWRVVRNDLVSTLSQGVMRGLDPRIHVLLSVQKGVDGRVKPGHDACGYYALTLH